MKKLNWFNYATRKSALYLIALALLVISCKENNNPFKDFNPYSLAVLKNDHGIFRDIERGISLNDVKANEKELVPNEADSSYLFYEIKIDSLFHYSLEYSFTSNKLKDVRIDIYSGNAPQTKIILENMLAYFQMKYGNHYLKNQLYFWTINNDTRLELIDESEVYGSGKITLLIYPEEEANDQS